VSISNDEIYSVLLEMKGDIGQLVAKTDSNSATLAKHIDDDKKMAADIYALQISPLAGQVQSLQRSQDRQRGFIAAISAVGTLIGAGIGYAIDLLLRHH
jgi:hypothetical protein